MLANINVIAWVVANIFVAYINIVLIVFVLSYYIFFDPRATTAGKMIFRFMLSLVGIVGLIALGTFIDPAHSRDWSRYPSDVAIWRPIIRLIVYGYVAYTITALSVLLAIRKWKPDRVRRAEDLGLVRVRHTAEIPVITSRKEK